MSNKMPHGRPNRMLDGMSEYMPDNMSAGGDHLKKVISCKGIFPLSNLRPRKIQCDINSVIHCYSTWFLPGHHIYLIPIHPKTDFLWWGHSHIQRDQTCAPEVQHAQGMDGQSQHGRLGDRGKIRSVGPRVANWQICHCHGLTYCLCSEYLRMISQFLPFIIDLLCWNVSGDPFSAWEDVR